MIPQEGPNYQKYVSNIQNYIKSESDKKVRDLTQEKENLSNSST